MRLEAVERGHAPDQAAALDAMQLKRWKKAEA